MSTNVPAFNIPSGFCGVYSLVQTNENLWMTTIVSSSGAIGNQISGVIQQLNNIPSNILSSITFDAASLISALDEYAKTTNSFSSHCQTLISNLIPNIRLACGQLAVQMGLLNSGGSLSSLGTIGLPGTNPCSAMDLFFGSITGTGATNVSEIVSALTSASNSISSFASSESSQWQEIADNITNYINSIAPFITYMSNTITSENTQLETAMSDITNQNTIGSVFGAMTNDVSASIINAVATSATQQYLGDTVNDPEFPGS